MTTTQTLQLELSELRQTINDLLAIEPAKLTEEQRAELATKTTRIQDAEVEFRASLVADPGPEITESREAGTAEQRELRALRGKVELHHYVEAAVEKRACDGAEAELNAALKIGAHKFPLEILAPVETRAIEQRATTDVDIATTPKRWLDRLFAQAAASRIGITFEAVESGAASFPIISAGASGAQRGRSEAAAAGAWTVGVVELKPTRNGVHAVFSREDDLRNPGLQDALTRDLRMALTDAVDLAIFEGDSGANEDAADITGLQTAVGVVEEEITQAGKITGTGVLEAFAALIDGKHATMGSELRTVLSVGAQRLWMSQLANTGASVDTTIAEFLKRAGIELSSRGGIDEATTADKFGAFVGRDRGLVGAGIAAVWSDGMLIVDPYSGAQSGNIQLSMNSFWSFGLPRPSNFSRLKFVA